MDQFCVTPVLHSAATDHSSQRKKKHTNKDKPHINMKWIILINPESTRPLTMRNVVQPERPYCKHIATQIRASNLVPRALFPSFFRKSTLNMPLCMQRMSMQWRIPHWPHLAIETVHNCGSVYWDLLFLWGKCPQEITLFRKHAKSV